MTARRFARHVPRAAADAVLGFAVLAVYVAIGLLYGPWFGGGLVFAVVLAVALLLTVGLLALEAAEREPRRGADDRRQP